LILRSLGWEGRETFTPMHPRDPNLASLFGWGAATAAGIAVNAETAMRSVPVYACVQILAQTVGQVDLCVHRRVDKSLERAIDHPLYDLLLYQPNRSQSAVEFKEMLQGHITLRGNGYAEILSTGGKGIAEIVPRHPDRVRPFWAPDGRRAYAYSDPNGPQRVILQDEMLHIMGLSFDGLSGVSPITYLRNTIGLELAQEEFASANIANGARPSGALSTAGKLNDDSRANLKKSWTEAMTGSRNSGKVAILEEGLKWEQLGLTLEDAQFLEQRKFSLEQIARIFRVPPHMIGDLSRSTNNNIEQQSLEFVQFTMMPWFVRWQQAIGRDLLSPTERKTVFARFDVDQLSSADLATRIELWNAGRQWGYLNADDIRARMGENPLPNGEGQAYLQPVNMQAVGSVDAAITAKVKEALKNANTEN
jgi:HK97 family phage portal protein